MDFGNFNGYTDLEKERWIGDTDDFKHFGKNVIIDKTAMIYGAHNISIGDNCYIGPMAYIRGDVSLGDGVWIGPGAMCNGEGELRIGKCVGIGNSVIILTCEHDQQDTTRPISFGKLIKNAVKIGDGANIGVGSIILPGVEIGIGAQIGAGSVVTKNTEVNDHEIRAGNPSKKIGTRNTPKEL